MYRSGGPTWRASLLYARHRRPMSRTERAGGGSGRTTCATSMATKATAVRRSAPNVNGFVKETATARPHPDGDGGESSYLPATTPRASIPLSCPRRWSIVSRDPDDHVRNPPDTPVRHATMFV